MNTHEELLEQRKNDEQVVKLGKALARLRSNRDFKLVIENAYMNEQAVQLVQASGNIRLTDKDREFVMKDIYAISSFTQFLDCVAAAAVNAGHNIEQIDAALNEADAEIDAPVVGA